MKRRILFAALISLLLITSCNAKKTHDTTPKRQGYAELELGSNLYGDVDSVTIIEYELTDKFGELVKDRIINKDVYKFNLRGDVVERIEYNSDGSFVSKHLYKYDSQGNMIEEAEYDDDGSLSSKYLIKYDSQGNMIEEIKYEGEIMKPVYKTEQVIVYRK